MMIPVGQIFLRYAAAAGAIALLGVHASGSQIIYRTWGNDLYRVGAAPSTKISYSGTQSLSVQQDGTILRFVARADCKRDDAGGATDESARFVQDLLPNGTFEDRIDDDPDFLTILNQPFAIRLDAATIHDLRELRAPVPFTAASPVGQGDLAGALRPGIDGILSGHHVVGVDFRADGTVNGPLPGRAATIHGHIHLDGTAFYDTRAAMLLALDARLTIDGMLTGTHLAAVPVRIIYDRQIKVV